ncbi:hypothetical protein BLS_009306 [Venturia inaequalis]|uniref:Phosphatidic acid phosphatase type 2/haloperoxidase domain-containing protein n=1 Tax=Venturia inaequalis TaxID=5025 RepID=A0A8H3YPW3_VENIN|nr:hypothetical protein BLS_009306 [Venturia inaequalis]KAE9969010.1 hypothetical protein EG328_007125 [Venturia inaequalis]KAE9972169.1 hypothetical protein EG327_009574 [Venturia inaequalis]
MENYGDLLPRKTPFSKRFLSAKVILSYIFDYAIIIVLAVGFFILDAVEPYHQEFSLKNYTLHYKYAVHERVPVPWLLVIVAVAPMIIIALYTIVIDGLFSTSGKGRKQYTFKSRLWELNCGILGLFLAIGASFVITGTLKNAIGKPRPDLVDRCQPAKELMDQFLQPGNFSLASHAICTQKDNAILKDGFRSFPSGHSSSAWAGLFYLSLYLSGKMHLLDSRGSRIMDARHHPFDVITGSLLGIFCAWTAYRQYFPTLSDYKAKGRAYPIRTWGRISENYQTYNPEDQYLDTKPLRQGSDSEVAGFEAARTGLAEPISAGGNVFRDEIHSSQTRRRQDAGERGAPSSVYSTDPIRRTTDTPSPMPHIPVGDYQSRAPGSNPFHRTGSRRQLSRDDWDESDEEASDDLELQPTYTLSQPSGPGHYDGTGNNPFEGQETSYKAPAAARPSGAPSDHRDGDIGGASSVPPQPPPHIEQPQPERSTRGVQLFDGPAR